MLLTLNVVLYVVALSLSLCVVTPVPAGASRRIRLVRVSLACAGGAAITAAITLSFLGLWLLAALAGVVALLLVCACMWVALSRHSPERDDGGEGSDGGGGQPRHPVAPEPPEPFGGPPAPEDRSDWTDFDVARAGWARERDPAGV